MLSRHARRWFVVAAAAACSVGLVAPAQAGDGRVQFVRGQGSDSTYDVMYNLDRAFNQSAGCNTAPASGNSPDNSTCVSNGPITTENNDHDIGISFFPVGSSNGVRILDKFGQPGVTKIDFARSSRARRSSDNVNLRFVAFAQDATPWVNFREGTGDESSPAAGVDDLTPAEMTDIWVDCTINNWNQIGGADSPILVWSSQDGSGERASFDAFVGGDSTLCISDAHQDNNLTNGERVIFENDSSPVRTCETFAGGSCPSGGTKQSIYHVGFGAWNASPTGPFGKDNGSDLGKINGIAPTSTTINDGTYLAKRLVYNVYRKSYTSGGNVSAAAYDYISEEGWICRPDSTHSNNPKTGVNYGVEIGNVITQTGFLPIPEAAVDLGDRIIQSKCRIS